MGGICGKRKVMESEKFNNYHCKKCKEIPLLDFSHYYFDMICANHKILNIPIDQFYNYISLDFKCFICKSSSNYKNFTYCFECDNIYCKICISKHNKKMNNSHILTNNIIEKNTICKLHNKKYNKYCIQCKLNLCELCENSYNHYTELFEDIHPLDEDIKTFKDLSLRIIKDNLEENDIINNKENEEEIYNNKIENECIKIKSLFVESFSKDITNYNYINNINNIIRCTCLNNSLIKNIKSEIKYIHNFRLKDDDINNIENKILLKSISKENTNDFNSQTWYIKKLNDIFINSHKKLELIGIGGSNHKILILNILNFKIYQIINEHKSDVYSLDQYNEDPNFLFSSSGDGKINIYTLNHNNYKYELIQKLKKSDEKRCGEINKVICLSNNLLVSGDHSSITIWKSKNKNKYKKENKNKNDIYYENIHEIIINRDTCNLLEINPKIFVAIQYSHGGHFQVYKNDDEILFPLEGELINIQSQGNSSNSLAKINENLVCSAANNNLFYIISIEPLQIIQKIKINSEKNITIFYIYITKDGYLYCKGEYQTIIQYKIIYDDENNFVELVEIGKYNNGVHKISYEKAILPFDDGRIFFVEEKVGQVRYNLIS